MRYPLLIPLLLVQIGFNTIALSVENKNNEQLRSNQYLYRVPTIPVSNQRRSNYISGPVIGTPDKGKDARWNSIGPYGEPMPGQQQYNHLDQDNQSNNFDASNYQGAAYPSDTLNKNTGAIEQFRSIMGDSLNTNNDQTAKYENGQNDRNNQAMNSSSDQDGNSYNVIQESPAQVTEIGILTGNRVTKVEAMRRLKQQRKVLEEEMARLEARSAERELDDASKQLFGSTEHLYEPVYEKGKRVLYRISPKQRSALKMHLPPIPDANRNHWDFQVLPPNISQKVYVDSNLHLTPVTFQYELDSNAFKLTRNIYDLENLRAILTKVSSINMQTNRGNTLLLQSVAYSNAGAMLLLIRSGANVNISNDFKVTPLHLATYMEDHIALTILLEYGAKMDIIDSNGMTPLMYAVMRGDRFAVEFLAEYGANVDFTNNKGMSAISIAKEYDDSYILRYLSKRSFNKNMFKMMTIR